MGLTAKFPFFMFNGLYKDGPGLKVIVLFQSFLVLTFITFMNDEKKIRKETFHPRHNVS